MSLYDGGKDLKAIANTDTRNKSEYDDFIGFPRWPGHAGPWL